jgi:hypothetical protein
MSFHILGNTFAKLTRTLAGQNVVVLVIRTASDAPAEGCLNHGLVATQLRITEVRAMKGKCQPPRPRTGL